jgi:chromate transporter
MIEIFWRFLLLGCTSFGGPAAHMGYFRKMFVEKLGWLDDERYARTVALSQFLPGPGSSQVGFAIGCHRGGLPGGLCAFVGFTLPSFFLMVLLSVASAELAGNPVFAGIVHGLKLMAVVVVADATLGMFGSFCKGRLTAGLCVATAALLLFFPGVGIQLLALLAAAIIGIAFISKEGTAPAEGDGRVKWWALVAFAVLFIATLFVGGLFSGFYQAGSLVFGGGHVVLPLLQSGVAQEMSQDQFLLGYAGAQAVPGPMFTLASFLGAELMPERALLGAALATAGIFLPGFLLMYSLLGAWQKLAARPRLAGAAAGLNAAVVGLLLAALFSPVFVSAVTEPKDFAFAVIGFYLLRGLKLPVLVLVVFYGGAGLLFR